MLLLLHHVHVHAHTHTRTHYHFIWKALIIPLLLPPTPLIRSSEQTKPYPKNKQNNDFICSLFLWIGCRCRCCCRCDWVHFVVERTYDSIYPFVYASVCVCVFKKNINTESIIICSLVDVLLARTEIERNELDPGMVAAFFTYNHKSNILRLIITHMKQLNINPSTEMRIIIAFITLQLKQFQIYILHNPLSSILLPKQIPLELLPPFYVHGKLI